MATEPGVHYYRNYNENDSTGFSITGKTSSIILSYDSSRLNFSPPEGKVFKEWNTARDGSGISYSVGESFPGSGSLYAIWEQETPITYYVTGTELTAVADAIRTKGGTSEALTWPDGFVNAIETVGGTGKTVTITLTNPYNPSSAENPCCIIYESDTLSFIGDETTEIGHIDSPTGSATVTTDKPVVHVKFKTNAYLNMGRVDYVTGVGVVPIHPGYWVPDGASFCVVGDGGAVITDVDYDD